MSDKEIKTIIGAAKDLGGEVSLLAKNVERVRTSGLVSSFSSSAVTSNGWSASPMSPPSLIDAGVADEDDEGNDSDNSSSSYSSLSHSLLSEDSLLDEEEEEGEGGSGGVVDTNMPFTILRALVLYRSLFSPSLSTSTSSSSSMLAPTISIEPPTPTIPSPLLSHLHTRTPTPKNVMSTSVTMTTTTTTTAKATMGNGQRKRMYALRKLLGSRVFEKDEVEDARDRVVDMLVEAERRSARA